MLLGWGSVPLMLRGLSRFLKELWLERILHMLVDTLENCAAWNKIYFH